MTRVAQVAAVIDGTHGHYVHAPVDVNIVPAGVEVNLGDTWAVLDDDGVLDLVAALLLASTMRRRIDAEAAAHARQMVEALDLQWPT